MNNRRHGEGRVLFVCPSVQDYLADGLLDGLRRVLGRDVVDIPKNEALYQTCPSDKLRALHGRGFSLYGACEDLSIDREQMVERLHRGEFEFAIFGSIWDSFHSFVRLLPLLGSTKTVIIDGADSPQAYPYAGKWWRRPRFWFLPRAHPRFLYFKREWTPETQRNMCFQLVPRSLAHRLPLHPNFRTISFCIPETKVLRHVVPKDKVFATHVVDDEVALRIPGSKTGHAFEKEQDYYDDLQRSKFAVTTKRAGWDCLRHYEIAANGCVPCFRDLEKKPATCAPHGLDNSNCLSYSCAEELFQKTASLSEERYQELQRNALQWVGQNTTRVRATQLLEACHYS